MDHLMSEGQEWTVKLSRLSISMVNTLGVFRGASQSEVTSHTRVASWRQVSHSVILGLCKQNRSPGVHIFRSYLTLT